MRGWIRSLSPLPSPALTGATSMETMVDANAFALPARPGCPLNKRASSVLPHK